MQKLLFNYIQLPKMHQLYRLHLVCNRLLPHRRHMLPLCYTLPQLLEHRPKLQPMSQGLLLIKQHLSHLPRQLPQLQQYSILF
jgi:hypothetical protein